MVFSNVIVDVAVPRRSSVFSQSGVQISAGLTNISGLAVAAFDHCTEPNETNTNPTPTTTVTIPYIKGTSEIIARILQPYNIRVAHRPITTLRKLLTNVKDKDQPRDRQGAVYKIKCCDCQATYTGETGRNLNTRLTERRRATRNGDINNNIAEHHLQTNHRIDWDSATCVTYDTNYYQRIVLESWFTNLEQTPINRCLQLPAPYKRLIDDINRQTTH